MVYLECSMNCYINKSRGLLTWFTTGLFIMLWTVLLSSCATPKNIDRDTQIDYSNDLRQMKNRMDSLLYDMKLMQKETSEKLSNLKIENTTTYLSVPDSTGRQYPTVISNTTANKEEKENKTAETNIEATMQKIITEVNELKEQLNAVISEKEKAKEVSWWQLHKVEAYTVVFIAVLLSVSVKRSNKNGDSGRIYTPKSPHSLNYEKRPFFAMTTIQRV